MKSKSFILYAATGILFGLAYPPFNLYTLIFPAFALLINTIHEAENYKKLWLRTYFIFLCFELTAISWIMLSGFRENADRFLILGGFFTVIIHSAFFTLPVLLYRFIRKNSNIKDKVIVYIFPFLWVAAEYFFSLGEASFPWLLTGNAFTTNPHKIQFIEITGVWGISLWASFLGVLLYHIFILYKTSEKLKNIIFLLSIFILVYFSPDLYTIFTKSKKEYSNFKGEKDIEVSVIQPNINPWKKWGAKQSELVNGYADLIRRASVLSNETKLIVLPETATPFYLLGENYEDKYKTLKDVCDSIGISVLAGTPDMVVYFDSSKARKDSKRFSSGLKYDTFNSAVLIEPGKDKSSLQKYSKIKLVTGSERMPYQESLVFLKDIIKWGVGISSFQTGRDTTIFKLPGGEDFSTVICYESIYPEFFSSFTEKGAGFCVVITNDGWWGKLPGTYQHNQYSVLRAIENRRWIVRCANTGISCFIDPYGNMTENTEINTEKIIHKKIGTNNHLTFYTKHRDLLPQLIAIFSAILFSFALIKKILKK